MSMTPSVPSARAWRFSLVSLEIQQRIYAGVAGCVAALRSSIVSMGFGYMRRRPERQTRFGDILGRGRVRPVCFSIRRCVPHTL
jgi:hypothetical protein